MFSTAYVFGSTSTVGQGRHSEDGVSKLRPALEELFDEYVGDFHTALFLSTQHSSTSRRRLRYSLDPGNAGKLIVYLD
jgi:hypothetical protein